MQEWKLIEENGTNTGVVVGVVVVVLLFNFMLPSFIWNTNILQTRGGGIIFPLRAV